MPSPIHFLHGRSFQRKQADLILWDLLSEQPDYLENNIEMTQIGDETIKYIQQYLNHIIILIGNGKKLDAKNA